jgi:alkanesulfonate monooxygenase SsuD/methylene tetrahydromethanopterin reductase-like flavin-dependent oxidoreductase (luciferase family)
MTDRPTAGVRLPCSGPLATAEVLLDTAVRAERLGYDSVWVNDHISWTRAMGHHLGTGAVEAVADQEPNFFESVSTLAVVGGRVPRVRLGVAGLVLPLRDPRILAKQLATTSQLVGAGRLVIAFAIGNIPNDFDVMGVRYDRRGRLTTEHLAALHAILNGPEDLAVDVGAVKFGGGTFLPRADGLTLLMTGGVDATYERIARYCDGWLIANETLNEYREALKSVRERVAALGRDPATLRTVYETFCCVAPTHEEAIRRAATSLADRYKSRGGLDDALATNLIGTRDEILERMHSYRAAGVQEFELKFVAHSTAHLAEMMEALA